MENWWNYHLVVCIHRGRAQAEALSPRLQLNGITPNQGFGVEFLLTLQLVMCVLAVTDKRRDVGGFGPLAIGLSVGLGHLAGVSISKHFPSLMRSMVSPSDTMDWRRTNWL